MRWSLLLLVLAAFPVMAEIHQCRNAQGELYYTDKQCPDEFELESSIAEKVQEPAKPREPIDFGDGLYQQFSKAKAILTNTQVKGRECEWAIKVDGETHKCIVFLALVIPGGDFVQAVDKLSELPDMDTENEIPKDEYQEILRVTRKIIDYKNLMITHLKLDPF